MPKEEATNEINDDLLLPPAQKVGESKDEQEAKVKVVDLEKIDLEKIGCKEQFEEEKEREDIFEGNQVSESSESLSQVN